MKLGSLADVVMQDSHNLTSTTCFIVGWKIVYHASVKCCIRSCRLYVGRVYSHSFRIITIHGIPGFLNVLNLAVNDVSASQISRRRFDGATAEIEHENVCEVGQEEMRTLMMTSGHERGRVQRRAKNAGPRLREISAWPCLAVA